MKMIQTDNLRVDPELCKRIDRVIYGSTPAPEAVVNRANVLRAELFNLLNTYNANLAAKLKDAPLFALCCWIERVQSDWSKNDSERGHANMQTAHNQLKNWK